MKVNDYYELPVSCEDGFIYSSDFKHHIEFDCRDTETKERKYLVAHVLNNYDNLADENLQMRELLCKLLKFYDGGRGGSLEFNGMFHYKVPESIFKKAKSLLGNSLT